MLLSPYYLTEILVSSMHEGIMVRTSIWSNNGWKFLDETEAGAS